MLGDGLILIALIKKLFKDQLGNEAKVSFNRSPSMQLQFLDNLAVAFKLLDKTGIDLNGIGPQGII